MKQFIFIASQFVKQGKIMGCCAFWEQAEQAGG